MDTSNISFLSPMCAFQEKKVVKVSESQESQPQFQRHTVVP